MKKISMLLILILFVLSLCFGDITFTATKDALTIWFEKLVPSMFVSLVCIRLLYSQRILHVISLPILPKLLHIDKGAFTLVLCSIFLGFPNGAVFIDEAYQRGELDEAGAKRLLYTCSYATPGFVIMTCGLVLSHSLKYGAFLFLTQICSGLILLWMTRSTYVKSYRSSIQLSPPLMKSLSSAIIESGKSLYMIGGYLMLFMSLTCVVCSFLPDIISMPIRIAAEFSSGIILLNTLPFSNSILLCLISFVLGFAGFCVHMQVLSMAAHVHISYRKFFLWRILQGILSSIIFALFLNFFL